RYVDDAMIRAAITGVAHKSIGHLSKGFRQRVGLADALVAKPPIVVLDEPTAGLDPNQIREARALIRDLGREHAVILSTHILSEVEACATRVLLLHKGKLIAGGSEAPLLTIRGSTAIEITIGGDASLAESALRAIEGVVDVARIESAAAARLLDNPGSARLRVSLRVTAGDPKDEGRESERRARVTERCVAALVSRGLGVRDVRSASGSLEDMFASLTRDAAPAPPARSRDKVDR
ncbi:MAG: ATP-binding cassette domain-containing protein, partial [Polyangiaceae bacterium]